MILHVFRHFMQDSAICSLDVSNYLIMIKLFYCVQFLLQIEYCPCSVANDCWNIMKEMAQSIVGNIADNPPPYLKSKPDPIYTPSDTVNQYLEHFNNFRKSVVQPSR